MTESLAILDPSIEEYNKHLNKFHFDFCHTMPPRCVQPEMTKRSIQSHRSSAEFFVFIYKVFVRYTYTLHIWSTRWVISKWKMSAFITSFIIFSRAIFFPSSIYTFMIPASLASHHLSVEAEDPRKDLVNVIIWLTFKESFFFSCSFL